MFFTMTSLVHSSLRRSLCTRLTRASIVSQYSIDLNYGDTVNDQEVDESDQDDALQILLKKPESQICRVSPLHGFEYTAVKLKQYALKIKLFLANNIKTSTSVEYSAEICIIDNLKLEVSHDDALKIVVWGSSPDNDTADKLLYHGVLFSWGVVPHREAGVAYLPLLLDCGKARVCVFVRRMLCKLFDCLVTPLTFTQSHLLLFSALLSAFPPVEGARLVSYEYKVPHTRLPTTLDFTMEIDDVHYFWKQCFAGDQDSSTHDEKSAQRLYSVFQSHISTHLGLDIATMQLSRLVFPGLVLSSSGGLNMREPEAAKVALRVLGQMATLLRGSVPKLAANYD